MLDEMAKASLVLAVMPDGDLRVIKNVAGSRTQEDGLLALAERLQPDLLDKVFHLRNTHVHQRNGFLTK